MKKFKITKGNRVYIVDAKSHIDAINKVKSVKDSSIRDYSPEVYVNELEKLIPEYIRLDKLRDKIIESLKSSGKIDSSNWRQADKYINDAKVQQWLKQVKELDKKWNKLLDNLSRFKGTQSYRRDTNSSDKDIWLDDVPYPREIKGIQSDIEIIGFLKGSMKNKDSISQWKPGMSEIGLFQISYKKGTVYQSILVKAATKEDAINKFTKHKPDAEVIGVNEYPNPHFGEPILDSKMKDFTFGYGLFTNFDMWVNSLDDINTTNLVNYIKNAVKRDLNCDVAEIKTGDVPSGVPGFKFSFIGKYRNNKDSRWNDMSGSLYVHPSSSLEAKYLAQGQEKGLTKPDIQKQLKSEIANKLKQFANKTIYKDTSITRDSAVKDGNNQLSVPKNLRVGSKIQTRNGTYTIIAIDNNDIATIQYENGRKFKLALYDIIDELDNVYTTKIIK